MKIQAVLEKAKFSKNKVLAFHGTSKKHLRSIIKNGLLINHSEGGLGSYEFGDDDFGYSLEPHEGIYFTTNRIDAENFAHYVDGENPIIIVARIQPKSTHMDEDQLFLVLDSVGNKVLKEIDQLLDKYEHDYDSGEMYQEIDSVVEEISKTVIQNTEKRLQDIYNLTPTNAQNIMKHAKNHIKNLVSKLSNKFLEDPDIREEQEALIKLLKNIVRKNIGDRGRSSETFSISQNIGFKGSNKIVGIMDLKSKKGWGEFPLQKFDRVNNPVELLN